MSIPQQRALAGYAARLRARFGDRLRFVRLFGSLARGDAHAGSDIDVAVVIDDLRVDEWREAVGLAADVQLEHDETLSPFVLSAERFEQLRAGERRVALDILGEGVPL
jgi:predicted nucleotidyltransferase